MGKRREAALIGLTPAQFWAMTPAELADMRAGWLERQEDDMQRRAWEQSILIKCMTGTLVHPLALLGKPVPDEAPVADTKEEFDQMMRERRQIADYGLL